MTNIEIIEGERILNNINEDLVLDTFQGWKNKGYQIIKGQKALFKTKIWKPRKQEAKSEENEEQKEELKNSRFILVNSAFFSNEQVQKIKESE